MPTNVPVKQSISLNRKRLAWVVFAFTLGLFLVVVRLLLAGYGNYVSSNQFQALLLVDALLFCFGIFSLIKSRLIALIVSLSSILSIFVVSFVYLIFFGLFYNDLFPGAINVQRLKTLEADGILNCPIADSTFQQAEHSHLTEYAGHPDSFDGGSTPTKVYRELNLNGADPKHVLVSFATCAHANGWKIASESISVFGDPTQIATGTKAFPGGWSASLSIDVTMHPTDDRGNPSGPPIIAIFLTTDYMP